MENQSPTQNLNEQTNTNTNTNTNIPMPVPLQVMIQNYQTMLNTINSPANQSGVVQANVVNRVGTLYKLISEFLLPIIYTLIDFIKAFISKIGDQDKKIDIQKENLDIQAHNLRVIGDLIDAVKADLKNTKIEFNKSMKAYHENLDKVTSEYHENINKLAQKLIQDKGQEIKPIKKDIPPWYAGGKTKKHRKHRRKVSK